MICYSRHSDLLIGNENLPTATKQGHYNTTWRFLPFLLSCLCDNYPLSNIFPTQAVVANVNSSICNTLKSHCRTLSTIMDIAKNRTAKTSTFPIIKTMLSSTHDTNLFSISYVHIILRECIDIHFPHPSSSTAPCSVKTKQGA